MRHSKRTQSPVQNSRNSSPSAGRPQESLFASSKQFNSPDPSSLPIPKFDEFLSFDYVGDIGTVNAPHPATKTDTLRQFLNIRPSYST